MWKPSSFNCIVFVSAVTSLSPAGADPEAAEDEEEEKSAESGTEEEQEEAKEPNQTEPK